MFTWTEADKERSYKLRNAYSPDSDALAAQPIFVMETACKLFYWACLTYFYKEDAVRTCLLRPLQQHRLAAAAGLATLFNMK